MSELWAVVMAAGHGTRMNSTLPKVLHAAAGRPLVYYPVKAALALGAARVIVVVNSATEAAIVASLEKHLPEAPLEYAVQAVPRGTGDAVRTALAGAVLPPGARVVILSGDTPLLSAADLAPILEKTGEGHVLSFLTFLPKDPTGYGRVLREENGQPSEIREHKDLRTAAEREVLEVNAGVYAGDLEKVAEALTHLTPNNAQGEYYLTDIVRLLTTQGIVSTVVASEQSLAGVNHRGELSLVEEVLFARNAQKWAKIGVTVRGLPRIDDGVELGVDVELEDGVRLRGATTIGDGTRVDVGVVVDGSVVGKNTTIKPYCVITDSVVGDRVQLGPFAHLRPGSVLEDESHIGNFVETKNTRVRRGAKANHLAYLGDGDIGEKANLGAGTILCNYDGFRKEKTVIGARAFIGSDSQLVAPVTIGDDAYVATGTTVTRDVPSGALAIGRVRQENKAGYGTRLRERLAAQAKAKKP